MIGRGFWVGGLGLVSLVAACPTPRSRPGALVVRDANVSGAAVERQDQVRIVEVPSPTFTVVSTARASKRVETQRTHPPDAVVVRGGRTSRRGEGSPSENAPSGTHPAVREAGQASGARPTCTSTYLRLLARAHLDTTIGRKAGAVADRYLLARRISPGSPAGRMIRLYLVGTALYDSGEISYPANPSAYGTGSHYARDLPERPLLRRSLRRAVRDALRSSHHALHFRDRLRAARVAGLAPNRGR